ncbi:MAG: response regulator, partial [Persicimonas sp.]
MADDTGIHPLLSTQLEAFGLSVDDPPTGEQWRDFLREVDDSYQERTRGALILDKNFDNLIAHAVDGFVLHDTDGELIDVNQAACEMLGYERHELLEMHVADFELELDPGAIWDDMTVDQVFTVEGTHRRKDGSTYPVETRVGAFMVEGEKVILALCRDITERKEAERELEQLNARLQSARDEALRASKAKSTFLANMSHELRTPLNAVIGYAEFLIEEMEDAGEERYVGDLERILTAGRHLLDLINDILDLSKIEAGKVELEVTEFEVESLLSAIESTVVPLAEKNDNTFEIDAPSESWTMRSDATKIRQILFNLLSNACKFTSGGRVRMSVESHSKGDALCFTVADTGVGMSDEELERVFKAFQQADSSTTRKFGGTGLGLAITRHYCRMLGGSIDVESTPGEGTTFTVVLPRDVEADDDKEGEEAPVTAQREEDAPQADAEGSTVLVIEDDKTARDLLRRTLEKEGYQVVTAENGRQGLHLARELEPMAVTLDILMPETDGWQVLSRMKRDQKLADIPVILVSMLDERQRGFALGADDYMVKPIDRERLVELVDGYSRERDGDRCLVVEDDEPTRELIERILKKEGWQVDTAVDGNDALQAARKARPDLVLLDLMMPRLDGFGFLDEFRADERFREVPVIVVTAKELTTPEVESLEEATSEIIHKAGRGAGEL